MKLTFFLLIRSSGLLYIQELKVSRGSFLELIIYSSHTERENCHLQKHLQVIQVREII